jgi:hypothetical protein
LALSVVEHSLDEDDLGPALDQRFNLLDIDVGQKIEVDLAITRIVHVGRQRQGLVGRPERAGDEALATVASLGVAAACAMIRAAATLMSRTRCSAA